MKGFISGHHNYHVAGIDSYLMRESRGDSHLLRVFHATDMSDIQDVLTDGDYSVAPHNHSFDLILFKLFGEAGDVRFKQASDGESADYEYPLSKDGNSFTFQTPKLTHLYIHGMSRIGLNGIRIPASDIHTVIASPGSAWLSVQVASGDADVFCYSRKPDFKLDTASLYVPMSDEDLQGVSHIFKMANSIAEMLGQRGVIEWQA